MNKNKTIIDEFEKLIDQIKYDIDHSTDKKKEISNSFRLRQIKNSLKIIKTFPKKIRDDKDLEELKQLKGIGKGTINRIKEIIDSGKLNEIKSTKKKDKYMKEISSLEEVINIGRKKAIDLVVNHNIKSVKQLKKAVKDGTIEVNSKVKLGLKYHGKIKVDIPREEIFHIDKYLNKIYSTVDKDLFGIICGSYRREKKVSSDIDVLLVHRKIKKTKQLKNSEINYLKLFVDKLKKEKFLIDDMTDKDIISKYMGFCRTRIDGKLKPIRRIDIEFVPYNSYYPALLYFTGSGEFNQKMRSVAQSLGFLLNRYGLYQIEGEKKKKIKIKSEKDIFKKLGMEYLEPNKR